MGLVSYIKDLVYNHKLNKAEKLLSEGKREKAELLLYTILDKQPYAAGKLADYYLKLAEKADHGDVISLFQKAVEIEFKGGGVYDAKSYNAAASSFASLLYQRAKSSFDSGNYSDCCALLTAVNNSRWGNDNTKKLRSESQILLTFKDIEVTKSAESKYDSFIDVFKKEWPVVRDVSRARESVLGFCDKLIGANRFYTSALLMEVVDKHNPKILDNVKQIVFKNDAEATVTQVSKIVSKYGKYVVFRSGATQEESVSVFDACWSSTKDVDLVMSVIDSATNESLRVALIDYMFGKHTKYFTNQSLFSKFSKWVYDKLDASRSLPLLERLHSCGYDTERYYVTKLHGWISSMPCDEKIVHLDHGQSLFNLSVQILDDKFDCAKWYLDKNENEKAIRVADSILSSYSRARVVKASAMCNLAKQESDCDKRIDLLNQAKSVLGNSTDEEFVKARKYINDNLIDAAENYFRSKENEKAYELLRSLAKEGVEQAAFTIAKRRVAEVKGCKNANEKLKIANDAIKEIKSSHISTITRNSDYSTLWDEYITAFILTHASVDNTQAVRDFEGVIKDIENEGFNSTEAEQKKRALVKQIVSRKYLIAGDLERSGRFEEAGALYQDINKLEASKTPTLSALRFILCKLKANDANDILAHQDSIIGLLRNAAEAFKTEKDDIAYRFALTLLKSGYDKEASSVLAEFLPNEEHLKRACEQGAMIKAQAKLEEFNNKLDAVRNKTLSSNDAVSFVNHIKEYSEVIEPILSIPVAKLRNYRNKLKNYAIFKLFDEERFAVAFEKMLKEHPDYLDDLTALRNIALVCLNMAESKQISDENYKEVISVWLTAIYQERLFIKSLDYTSWDDQYNFSLDEAYGHFNEDTIDDLPENVNFEYYDPDDTSTVYIKDVQRALLDRFEAAISENQQYHEFHSEQQDAMDAFIALNLDEKCRLVAPYLARRNGEVFEDITEALEQERENEYDNWEDVLAVGAIYQLDEPIYSDYNNAKEYYQACVDALDSKVVTRAKQAFTKTKVSQIKEFEKLESALVSKAKSKVTALNANTMEEFKGDFNYFMVVCDAIKDNTLSFVFSKYVMHFVVGEVNAKRLSLAKAADYILSVYLLDPSNSKVQDNLSTLFEMLVREDDSSEKTQAVSGILNKVSSVDSSLHRKFLREKEDAELDEVLNDIVAKVNSNTMSKSVALDKVYAIYKIKPNNSRVCANLAQLSSLCVVDYVMTMNSGYLTVQKTLDLLKNNKSLEFKKHSSEFKDAYDTIWGQLSVDIQLLIQGFGGLGSTLNDKGYALKRGLKYLEELGGFTGTGSRSPFGSLRGNSSLFG